MRVRIRHIARRRKGQVIKNELITEKSSINIGRATDQDIFLPDLGVAYRHARLTLADNGHIGVASLTPIGIHANGRLSQSASMKGDGRFQVGPYDIEVKSGHDGFDFDITIEQIAEDIVEKQSEQLPALLLEDTWLSRRRGAWVGFLLVLLVFMLVPMLGVFDEGLREQSRDQLWMPDDGLWVTGQISSPHRHFADDCNACHLEVFEMSPDRACIACHESTTTHADPELYDLHAGQGMRCASCHKEHNGDAYLVRSDQALCTDCHENINDRFRTELPDIADFSSSHPEFRPLLFTVGADGVGGWHRHSLADTDLQHETGLVFPHDVHLDAGGLDSPSGEKVLQCDDCHRTDAGNSYMLPIEYEQHCQECHNLTFDTNSPERELPHSNLDAITATLDEYYAFMALRGGYQDEGDRPAPDIVTRRRIPGKVLTPVQMRTALVWAQDKAAEAKDELIESRACGYCHEVVRDTDAASGWHIPEVRISQRWFTGGLFDHASHTSTACDTCHEAETSENSEQLLMPGIDVCRDCHGDPGSDDKLHSGCVSCHVYHVPGNSLLGERDR